MKLFAKLLSVCEAATKIHDPRHINPKDQTPAARHAARMLYRKDVVQNWKNAIKGAENRLKQANTEGNKAEAEHAKHSIETNKKGLAKAEIALKDAEKILADAKSKANKHEDLNDNGEIDLVLADDKELANDQDCDCKDEEDCECEEVECGSEIDEKDNVAYMHAKDSIKANQEKINKLQAQSSDLFNKSKNLPNDATGSKNSDKRKELNKKRFEINNLIQGLEDSNKDYRAKLKKMSKRNESLSKKLIESCKKVSEAIKPKNGEEAAGFDLTDIPVKDWKELLSGLGISEKPIEDNSLRAFVWKNKDVMIVTAANPLADGLLFDKKHGTRGEGYLSYVGIQGNPTDVEHIYNFISDKGEYKDREFGKRSFI